MPMKETNSTSYTWFKRAEIAMFMPLFVYIKENQIRVLPINSVLLLVVADFESVECVDVSDRLQVFDVMFNDMGT